MRVGLDPAGRVTNGDTLRVEIVSLWTVCVAASTK